MNSNEIAAMRRNYTLAGLTEQNTHANPFIQFRLWFEEAKAAQILEPNAMTLSTVSPEGQPEARIVLLKDFDERGFVFFTNYDSSKGRAIAGNPRVCLLFFWGELERQVRINGFAAKISREESDEYFQSRPRESRIGAWTSNQSAVISGRGILEERFETLSTEYAGKDVPIPPYWGGYRVEPKTIEFWQGRESRLHDRLLYERRTDANRTDGNEVNTHGWSLVRLSP